MINRVILMGRLVGDPELKTTQSGVSVTAFRSRLILLMLSVGGRRRSLCAATLAKAL